MTDLPRGWAVAPLGDLAENRDNRRVPVNASERASRAGAVPYYGAAGQVGWIDQPLFDEELLLLGEDGVQFFDPNKTKAYMISGPSWVNNHAHVLAALPGVHLGFLMHYLNQFHYQGFANGTTRLKLTRKAMDQIPVHLAPTAEQVRIVAAVEEAFSLLDAGETSLRATRTRLKRMRDSVLAAAVTGQLVHQDPTDTPAANRLANEGVAVVAADDDDLPHSWIKAAVADVATVVSGNTPRGLSERAHPEADADDVPLFKVGDLGSPGPRVYETRSWLNPADAEALGVRVHPAGTILFPKRGGAIATNRKRILGVDGAFDLNTMGLIPRGSVGPWLWLWIQQFDLRTISDGSNVPQLNHSDVAPLSVLLPPPEEQARIVAEVERQFSFIEVAERAVDTGLARSAALRRSVLKAAFEGRLVPQDPSDEPASVLLERIAAERAAAPKRASRRGRAKVEAS